MKTDLLLCTGLAMVLLALPSILHAGEDGSGGRAPLALGQPMADCAPREQAGASTEPVDLPGKEAIAAPKSPAAGTGPAPHRLSTATLLTFALIASPGTGLPQTGSNANGR
ncbi:MAG: hypothetical protein OJJ21_13625 [Ferrovibrio sp.]|uniref:hypothetical protein n=1 Tax=Ferrovibrio sp. TaxID=1917215 RepID=UPI0026343C5B|nr:hypothetical protein [Ferrovibrio sp.]MCW0234635.1 hypothetical protein [Ferrovibrio sp.]